ncbi:MAG: sugar ABC transporter substrate-binding protein [Devosia sp.]
MDPRFPWRALAVGTAIFLAAAGAAVAQAGPPGVTAPTVFGPFDAAAPRCSAPSDLAPVIAYVQQNDREFLQGVDHGLALAAKDRGLAYRRVLVGDDAANAARQIDALRVAKVGAIIATSSDPNVVRPTLQAAIWSGEFVGTIVPPPATLLLNAPQYQTGKVLADAAIDYIKTKLGGKASVVLLTQDSMQYLAPRFDAMRDELNLVDGVEIVADIAPDPVSKEGGFKAMQTVLQAYANVDVVLGADAVVLGALEALRAAGKDRPEQFLGGIDGEPEAVAEIKAGNGPYKASIALSSPVFGYAMGQYGADWLEGKSVPQAMDILPIALTSDNMAQYEADLKDPAAAFNDPLRRASYLTMYGNICYDTRDQYVNFPWSSEAAR